MNQQQLAQLRAQLKIAAQLNTCTTTTTHDIYASSGITSPTPVETLYQTNNLSSMSIWKSCPEAPQHLHMKCPLSNFSNHQIPIGLLAQERDNYIQLKMQTYLRKMKILLKNQNPSKHEKERAQYIIHSLFLNSRQKYVRDNFYDSYVAYSSGNPLKRKDIVAIVRMKPLSQQEQNKNYVIRGISYNDFLWPAGRYEFIPETPFSPQPRFVVRDRQKQNPDIDLKQTLPVVKSVLSASASLIISSHAFDFFSRMRQNYQISHKLAQNLAMRQIQLETNKQTEMLSEMTRNIESIADADDDDFFQFWEPPIFTHGIRIYPQPTNLDSSVHMHKHQIEGMSWLIHLYDHHVNAILADQTGLGKTLQVISFLAFLNEYRHISGPHLVVMPNSVLEIWRNEFLKWYPAANTILYIGKRKRRRNLFENSIMRTDFDVLLTSYMVLMMDIDLLSEVSWQVIVFDEAHKLKNQKTELFSKVNLLYSDFRILSTATPFQNDIDELWSILFLIAPEKFCSLSIFKEFFRELESRKPLDDRVERTLKRLHEIIRPYLLRRIKNDLDFDIPKKLEVTIKCSPSPLQSEIIDKALELSKTTPFKSYQKILLSRKVSNSPILFLDKSSFARLPPVYILSRSPKLQILDRILKKLILTGHRFLIYSQWTTMMDIIQIFLRYREINFARIDGSVPDRERMRIIQNFVAPGSLKQGLLLSTRSSAFGLNLQVADTVILFDSDYNPFVELQASARVHRLGQKNVVVIIRLMMNGTGEEHILRVSRKKFILGHQIIEAGRFNLNQKKGNENDGEEDENDVSDIINELTSKPPEIPPDPPDDILDGVVARSSEELFTLQSRSSSQTFPEEEGFKELDEEIIEKVIKGNIIHSSSDSDNEDDWVVVE